MDFCAISPTDSFLVEYTEKKTCFSNSAGILGQHDIVVLADVPPPQQKSWILSELQLFQSFPTEVAQNDWEWPILPDSHFFLSFPTKVAQNDSEQPILPDSQLFQSFLTEVAQNDSEMANSAWPK